MKWTQAVMAYPCPRCGAAPHDPCTTAAGKPSPVHVGRIDAGSRCRKCGGILPPGAQLGDLCGRCQVVETLIVERYSRPPRSG